MPGGPLDRFDLRPLFLDHLRSMRRLDERTTDNESGRRPDVGARVMLYGVPLAVGLVSLCKGWKLTDPGAISAASALIAGILFAAFTQLATLRERLEDRTDPIDGQTRMHLRETAAHLMMGSFAAAVEAVILVAASGSRNHPDDKLAAIPTALALAVGAYIFLLFTMSIRRMYSTYLRVFEGGQYLRPRDRGRPSDKQGANQ